MKRGIDVGNYSLKEFPSINIKSLVTTEENVLGSNLCLEYEGKKYFIGEGKFETELNKSNKKNFLPLLLTGTLLNIPKESVFQQIVCGLPINQYEANRKILKDMVLRNRVREVVFNKEPRKIVITDFEVYPEGVGAYYSFNTNDDCIIVDIGGRTTDIAYIANGELKKHSTVVVGTINIYKDIADKLNADYSLDLDIFMAEKILDKGYFELDGNKTDLRFITEILKDSFVKINDDLILKFPCRTEKIVLVGGGYKLFQKAFKNRYPNSYVADNPIYANSIGFGRVAKKLWG